MHSLKNVRFALDGEILNWSVRKSVGRGIWPKLSTQGTSNISIAELCKRFSRAGHELRILADGETKRWEHISRGDLVASLRQRIRNPGVIQQRPTDLCGPISVLMEFARRHPARYVRGAAELLHDGRFTPIAGNVIVAPEDLRGRPVPDGDITSADWIYAATMRDAENFTEDVDDGEGLEGATLLPSEVIQWVKDLLGLDTYYYNCWSAGEMDALRNAQSDVDAGGVAILFIDNGLIHKQADPIETPMGSVQLESEWVWMQQRDFKPDGQGPLGHWSELWRCEHDGAIPNHWAVLLGGLAGSRSKNHFKVRHWSFGREYENTGNSEGFGEYLYGVVAGRLP